MDYHTIIVGQYDNICSNSQNKNKNIMYHQYQDIIHDILSIISEAVL